MLEPRDEAIGLRRAPVEVISKTTHNVYKGVLIPARCLVGILLNCASTVPLSLLNKACSLAVTLTTATPAFYWLAFRQPVTCLPMLSINAVNSACFLKDTTFKSTHRRISNLTNSNSSKKLSNNSFFCVDLLAR